MNQKIASFTSLVRNFGIEISNKCLGTGIIKNRKYFADKLGLSEEDEIYGIHRIRLGNKEPLAIEFTYVPLHFFQISIITILSTYRFMII